MKTIPEIVYVMSVETELYAVWDEIYPFIKYLNGYDNKRI